MISKLSFILLILVSCSTLEKPLRTSTMTAPQLVDSKKFYQKNVQPLFNSRCVACHACYNSPCQLNLTSYEGLTRGGNKQEVYDFPTFTARKPTRLYIDAHSPRAWRKKDFHTVLYEDDKFESILNFIVGNLPGIESGKQKIYDSESSRACMKSLEPAELEKFVETNPAGRMPFGLPAISQQEEMTLRLWQDLGAPGPDTAELEKNVLAKKNILSQVRDWESFLNASPMKNRLTARYLYEHLFLAHIYFPNLKNNFFRLVRSETQSGTIREIGSSYPFDDPGRSFFYRLRPVTQTMTHKSNIPFLLSPQKLQSWRKSFVESRWNTVPKTFPPYGRKAANPFQTFQAIPVTARYQFMLDEAGYHVMTFIKGPVCRGQTALNVINDHFWVMFVDPKKDPLATSPQLYKEVSENMVLPASRKGDLAPFTDSRERYWKSVGAKYKVLETRKQPLNASWIWNGQKTNTNAALTVYRHFDSANVIRGFRGELPKTVWLMDYHVFETVYYNLTAGYNVFGPIAHQLGSRLFMEVSRIASEDLFLTMLTPSARESTRKAWNTPAPEKNETIAKWLVDVVTPSTAEKMKYKFRFFGKTTPSSVPKRYSQTKEALLTHLMAKRFSKVQRGGQGDMFSGSSQSPRSKKNGFHKLKGLTQLPSRVIMHFPDTILIRVQAKRESQVFTLIHNKSHYNVSRLLFEDQRRNPSKDSADILPEVATSYANLFVDIRAEQIPNLVTALERAQNRPQVMAALAPYAINRSHKNFWSVYEWFSQQSENALTHETGWLDLNRYVQWL